MVEIRAMRNSFVAEVSDQLSGVFVDQIPRIANKLPVRGDDPLSSGIAFQRDFGIVLEDLCELFTVTKNPRGMSVDVASSMIQKVECIQPTFRKPAAVDQQDRPFSKPVSIIHFDFRLHF